MRNLRTSRAGKHSLLSTAAKRFDGDGPPPTLEDPAIKALVDAAVAEATKGLITNRDSLLGEKKALMSQVNDLTKQWDGLDPEMVKNLVVRMKTDEETRLLAEGKVDEVINRRVEAMQRDFNAQLTASKKRNEELESEVGSSKGQIKDLKIETAIKGSAAKLGLHSTAFDDAVFRARGTFDLDAEGNLIAKDATGAPMISRNGRDPLAVDEWLEGMKDRAPHWFPAPTGAGANGGGNRGGKNNFTLSREEARDPQKYQAMKEAAAKAGQSVEIVEG
jgi:hypothetical protein